MQIQIEKLEEKLSEYSKLNEFDIEDIISSIKVIRQSKHRQEFFSSKIFGKLIKDSFITSEIPPTLQKLIVYLLIILD